MKRENFELAAKILFFGTLEESFAIESAKKTFDTDEARSLLHKIHNILQKRKHRANTLINLTQGSFSFPAGVDLSYWREFKIHCPKDVFSCVLYKWIGGFDDDLICAVLNISSGSLHTRYNQGLKVLGEYLINKNTSLEV